LPVNDDFKHAIAGPLQRNLGGWVLLLDEFARRTGARFIASLAAVFDFNLHLLRSPLLLRRNLNSNMSNPAGMGNRGEAVSAHKKKPSTPRHGGLDYLRQSVN
jgi:hypothetical protein